MGLDEVKGGCLGLSDPARNVAHGRDTLETDERPKRCKLRRLKWWMGQGGRCQISIREGGKRWERRSSGCR